MREFRLTLEQVGNKISVTLLEKKKKKLPTILLQSSNDTAKKGLEKAMQRVEHELHAGGLNND